ncbi:MAG: type II secretion system protein GspG [Planctomycetes bacterium]|nr:type II secretion system protein GspG [Planctomycetota bacterium]
MRTRTKTRRAGFTLAELMVVIVIIGLLATLVVPNVVAKLGKANLVKAKADIVTISGAVTEYAIDNGGKYPETIDQLIQPDQSGHAYIDQEKEPKDPWGNPYQYEPPTSGQSKFRVLSLGRDGAPGGDGDDADIDNVMIRNGEI